MLKKVSTLTSISTSNPLAASGLHQWCNRLTQPHPLALARGEHGMRLIPAKLYPCPFCVLCLINPETCRLSADSKWCLRPHVYYILVLLQPPNGSQLPFVVTWFLFHIFLSPFACLTHTFEGLCNNNGRLVNLKAFSGLIAGFQVQYCLTSSLPWPGLNDFLCFSSSFQQSNCDAAKTHVLVLTHFCAFLPPILGIDGFHAGPFASTCNQCV